MNRYNLGEDEFEPGSNGLVLRNKLGITDPGDIERVETDLLFAAIDWSYDNVSPDVPITMEVALSLHSHWLGNLYAMAGQLRTVNVSKAGFMFAPVAYFESSIKAFNELAIKLTPLRTTEPNEAASHLAEYHAEFILLHPFREGNGRTGRWLLNLAAFQVGLGPLNFKFDEDHPQRRDRYFAALRLAFAGKLESLTQIFEEAWR